MRDRQTSSLATVLFGVGTLSGGFLGGYLTDGSFGGIFLGVIVGLLFGALAIGYALFLGFCAVVAAVIYGVRSFARSEIGTVVSIVVFLGMIVAFAFWILKPPRVVVRPAVPRPQPVKRVPVVTKKVVAQVATMLEGGLRAKDVAAQTGLSISTVYRIKNGKYDATVLPDA